MKVSVVTPFYNTARYLTECIDSVLAQSYRDFEYVLVDNHSTDGGDAIAARYAARDPRVRVVRPPAFLPQVPNYNFAMRQIARDAAFVKVVQADDTIFPRCLAEMVALAEAHPSIGVVSSYRMYGDHVQPSGLSHTRTFLSGRDACRIVLKDEIYLFGTPTTVLFRADLVRARDPFFTEGRFFEDTEIVFDLLAEHDFGFVHQVLSFTRTDNDSIWTGMRGWNGPLLSKRNQLAQYGRRYLDDGEFAAAWREREGEYRKFLAEAWLRRADAKFWKFHREGLATVGDTIERTALARDALRVAAGYLVAPKRLGDELLRKLRRR
ncbi:MAG TPA: glycosyltransferase family 2 protein [Kofleriaceae bacterium]|nr:glycosyltransferase family 2 protein [Kofleriaceae bacterium]